MCVCRADSFSRRMFLRNSALEKGASFPPLLPQESVLQNRRKQRRLRNMASLRVAFAIACVLTVAVWRSQAFLLSRPAGATGAKFGGFESHAARVVTLKSGPPPPPQAEIPTLIEAGAFDGPAAKAIASPVNSDADSRLQRLLRSPFLSRSAMASPTNACRSSTRRSSQRRLDGAFTCPSCCSTAPSTTRRRRPT